MTAENKTIDELQQGLWPVFELRVKAFQEVYPQKYNNPENTKDLELLIKCSLAAQESLKQSGYTDTYAMNEQERQQLFNNALKTQGLVGNHDIDAKYIPHLHESFIQDVQEKRIAISGRIEKDVGALATLWQAHELASRREFATPHEAKETVKNANEELQSETKPTLNLYESSSLSLSNTVPKTPKTLTTTQLPDTKTINANIDEILRTHALHTDTPDNLLPVSKVLYNALTEKYQSNSVQDMNQRSQAVEYLSTVENLWQGKNKAQDLYWENYLVDAYRQMETQGIISPDGKINDPYKFATNKIWSEDVCHPDTWENADLRKTHTFQNMTAQYVSQQITTEHQ